MAISKRAYSHTLRNNWELITRSLNDASSQPFWSDELPSREPMVSLTGDATTDLVVVGGGFCGLWTALQAKQRTPGRSVILIEANEIGWAASGRNGGICKASLTHGVENGRNRFADELDTIHSLEQDNFAGIRETIERYRMKVEFEERGTLAVAAELYQIEELRRSASTNDIFLDSHELTEYIKSPLFHAGLLTSRDTSALLHPVRMARELLRVCLELGVQVYEHTSALNLEHAGSSIHVQTPQGRIVASQVALATNGFPSLVRRVNSFSVPIYDYALVTEPLSTDQLEKVGWTGRYGLRDCSRQFHYSRKTSDNRILWGGYDAVYYRGGHILSGYDQRAETFRVLADHFFSTFPFLHDVHFTHAWGGMIDMSTRLVPTQGTAFNGKVAYSIGYTGLGVAATRFGAATMLDLLDGIVNSRTRSRLATGRPIPIPPEPLAYPIIQMIHAAVRRADERGRPGILLRILGKFGVNFDS